MPVERLSNVAENFAQGGLYPGGSGVFTEFHYRTWDYGGTMPPDSFVAVHGVFQPTDGSNEGKPVEIFWNIGEATNFVVLDGGAFLGSEVRKGLPDGCNWKQALEAFKKSGGLDDKLLDGPSGILVLRGTEATITRVDQHAREGLNVPEEKESKDGKKYTNKRQIYVPTRCKYPWEKGGAARPVAVMPSPAVATAHAAAVGGTVPAPAASAPGTMPNPMAAATTGTSFADVVDSILTTQGGTIEMAALPKLIVESPAQIDRAARIQYTKDAKDDAKMTALATERGWTYGGGMLIK